MTNRDAPGERPRHARVTQRVTLRFDEFGWQGLESEARRDGLTLEELLGCAVAYFDAELPTTRAALCAPRFKPRSKARAQQMSREIRLELTRGGWEHLQSEAGRQGIPLERLLEHAPLLYLADVDSGRVVKRVLRRAEEEKGQVCES